MKKVVTAFYVTFLSLALIAAILYFGFEVDLTQWYWKLLIGLIMFGVPIYTYIKNKES